MNFANLTPAERMKASGLIGLIVVVVFFVVYTMMGSLGGKKPAATPPPSAGEDQASTSVPQGPLTNNPGQVVDPANPFPIGDAKTHQASAQNQDLYQLDDPFKPIRSGKPTPSPAAMSAMNGGHAPSMAITPAHRTNPL